MGDGKEWPRMPAQEFIAMMSRTDELGNPLIATQHLLGGSSWERISECNISGTHQLRAAHIRYEADESGNRSEKAISAVHGHATIKHFYRKGADGAWKLAGLEPSVLFNEGDFSVVFN